MMVSLTSLEVTAVKEAIEAAVSELRACESEEGWVVTTDCFELCNQALLILKSVEFGEDNYGDR
jgi:hypothetical protein